jgi:TPR repeat protein
MKLARSDKRPCKSAFLCFVLVAMNGFGADARAQQHVQDKQAIEDCIEMGTRRSDQLTDGKPTADVEIAAFSFRIEMVSDTAALCALALKQRPDDVNLREAYDVSFQMLRLLTFGINGPVDDQRAFSQAYVNTSEVRGLSGKIAKFYLGLAFEYGIGTKADRLAALHWYRQAANDGDGIAAREHARLENTR